MKIGKWKGRILTGAAALALAAAGAYELATKTDIFDGKMPARVVINEEEKELEIPAYNLAKVHPANCSKYARMCAKKVFGKSYGFSDAWDRRYEDQLVCNANNLEQLAEDEVLKPGMLVTWNDPESRYARGRDRSGAERNCSHVAVYVGRDSRTNELLFAEQRGWKKQVIGYSRFKSDGLTPVEVIDSK